MPAPKVPLVPWPVDQPLPAVLTDRDLMRVVQLRLSAFYRLKRLGTFRRLEVKGVTVGATRYSGELVRRYVASEPLSAFGRARTPRAASTVTLQ